MATIGIFLLDEWTIILTAMIAFWIASIILVPLYIFNEKIITDKKIPFTPFISVGTILMLFFRAEITDLIF